MKIGIYGGSFNPPHLGHLQAAVAAAKLLELDRLLLIPAGLPPHKALAGETPAAEHRLAMTAMTAEQAALELDIPVEVSDTEIRREGKSYTADTLAQLREQEPDAEFWLLMGTDMFLSFQTWYHPEKILACAGLCAFGRSEKDSEELFAAQRAYLAERYPGARIATVTLPKIVDISSTELRAGLPEGKGQSYLLPQVYGYILRERLYGTHTDLKHLTPEQLRPIALSYLKAKRIPHVLGTEQTAALLAERCGADVRKARIAALLHDCTKRLEMEEQKALCKRYGITLDALESRTVKLLHAKTGAALAREVFGVDDDVYDAIYWHTTGRGNMTPLEKVIYLADYMEPTRSFDGVEELRKAVRADIDRGLLMGLSMSIAELRERGKEIHRDTMAAYEYLKGTLHE